MINAMWVAFMVPRTIILTDPYYGSVSKNHWIKGALERLFLLLSQSTGTKRDYRCGLGIYKRIQRHHPCSVWSTRSLSSDWYLFRRTLSPIRIHVSVLEWWVRRSCLRIGSHSTHESRLVTVPFFFGARAKGLSRSEHLRHRLRTANVMRCEGGVMKCREFC